MEHIEAFPAEIRRLFPLDDVRRLVTWVYGGVSVPPTCEMSRYNGEAYTAVLRTKCGCVDMGGYLSLRDTSGLLAATGPPCPVSVVLVCMFVGVCLSAFSLVRLFALLFLLGCLLGCSLGCLLGCLPAGWPACFLAFLLACLFILFAGLFVITGDHS